MSWTPDKICRLRALRSEGMRSDQIARELGMSEAAVRSQSTKLAICDRNIPAPEIENIVELAGEGVTVSRIARKMRIDVLVVERVLERHGVTARTLPSSYHGPEARRACR